ncbi:MAG TPA: glycoside hydrolase family 27 protein [Caulobacteraceae bacterium]|jgi:alpha-galactosidase|nr:glycoside hydrolase family 27 protein [Caulobacteraceae bacterium]
MKTTKAAAAALLSALALATTSASGETAEPLTATPPMGWNSWNHFAGRIDDRTIRVQADAMVSSGLRDAGYRYINIDDTWQGRRDARGEMHPNARFPDMKALADYVHSKGLKLGLYSSPGPQTCEKYEGSFGHEEQDARTYAAWGVDYLKYDLCSMGQMMLALGSMEKAQAMEVGAYRKMGEALRATGRPILYSFCQYGFDQPWRWAPAMGANAWRTTGDIKDSYARMSLIGFSQAGLAKYAGPGHWNDPDMLEVGNGGMKPDEYRTHMSLWALLAAPLLAGNDLTKMSPETVAMLTNREVIAIDQDPAGRQGDRVWAEGELEIWARPLADGAAAVGLFNRSGEPAYIEVAFKDAGVANPKRVRDVWAGTEVKAVDGRYRALVAPHGVVLLEAEG